MRTCFYLLFILLLLGSAFGQINVEAGRFPIKVVSADVISIDSSFRHPMEGGRVRTRTFYGRGIFDHFVYNTKVCFMLEMGKEWDQPFTVYVELPNGYVDKYVLNREKEPLPDHNFFYYNIVVHSKNSGFARIKAESFNNEDDVADYNIPYTSFFLPYP